MKQDHQQGTATRSFFLSETPKGSNVDEDHDVEHTVRLTFSVYSWDEHHPFGDTTAVERRSEVDDSSYQYELDGEEVEPDELRERFGPEFIDSLLDGMDDDATLTTVDPFDDY